MYNINSHTTDYLILDKINVMILNLYHNQYLYMVCMSNKSILLSLVAGVEFSYHISVTVSPITLLKNLCGDVSNIKQTKYYFIGAANGVSLQRYSGLDTGVEL